MCARSVRGVHGGDAVVLVRGRAILSVVVTGGASRVGSVCGRQRGRGERRMLKGVRFVVRGLSTMSHE
jgi:hypothetical protein